MKNIFDKFSQTGVRNFFVILIMLAYVAFIFSIGYTFGNIKGFEDGLYADKKSECELKFYGKPLGEVNTECLEYLK